MGGGGKGRNRVGARERMWWQTVLDGLGMNILTDLLKLERENGGIEVYRGWKKKNFLEVKMRIL